MSEAPVWRRSWNVSSGIPAARAAGLKARFMKLFSAMRVFGTASRGRTVADSSEFCVHHTRLLETVDAGRAEAGRTPKRREGNQPILCVVPEPAVGPETAAAAATLTRADPATVGPSLATAAAENVEQLTASRGERRRPRSRRRRVFRRPWLR
jgi:hypothetical protein